MDQRKVLSIIAGFLLLFFLYHFPEFFSAFWIMAVFKIGFLLAAYVLARVQTGKGMSVWGLGLKGGWYKQLGTGLLLGLGVYALSVLGALALGYEKLLGVPASAAWVSQLPMILLMTAIPSLAEDILTRAYGWYHFGKRLNPYLWMLLSSLIYVLNHIWRLNEGPAVLGYLFLLGLVLACALWMVKSLWLAFGIHWGANIAFECYQAFVQTENLNPTGSTWVLAAAWGLLLLFMIMNWKKKFNAIQASSWHPDIP